MTKITYREAVSRALRESLQDDRVFLMGEDIGYYGGPYAVTKGFVQDYGEQRIKDTPISESVIVGAGIGAAMAGLRPIVELMTINFSLLAMDQIVNHAAKLRYMSGGQFSVPLIIRTVTGGGAQLAATHSQSFEGWYAHVPGLKVVVPSNPYDALGLFRSALQEEDPVIFVEHALLYGNQGEVPDSPYTVPIGKADVKRDGTDLTIISSSRMVQVTLEAAEELKQEGISAEVIDLRTLRPLDTETLIISVERTHRALVVEEDWRTGGFAGEIASEIQEHAFDMLDAPVGRLAGIEVPMPYAANLERAAIPSANRIAERARRLVRG